MMFTGNTVIKEAIFKLALVVGMGATSRLSWLASPARGVRNLNRGTAR